MTLLILACTLNQQNWWPAIVIIFYLLAPFPILISRQVSSGNGFGSASDPAKEWAYFITTGVIISALALPILMARVGTVSIIISGQISSPRSATITESINDPFIPIDLCHLFITIPAEFLLLLLDDSCLLCSVSIR